MRCHCYVLQHCVIFLSFVEIDNENWGGLSMAEICPTSGVEKILLATDGSEYSKGAVREAIRLANKCSSKLIAPVGYGSQSRVRCDCASVPGKEGKGGEDRP